MTEGRKATLEKLFTPRSVAVIGASRDPRKLGYIILDNLLRGGFSGDAYAVNPSAEEVLGARSYKSIAALPAAPDLAVIVVPAAAVPGIIDDCVERGVGAAIIISAGFRETGEGGGALEREVARRARAGGLRLVGPNSVGVINTFARLNVTFAAAQPLSYPVTFISQSGAVATAILDWARGIGVGFAKFVSLGNMADVSEVELLEYLRGDDETKLVVAYLEGFSSGRDFRRAASELTRVKPVIAMKVGRSTSGARAAASHTGALASADAVVEGAFRQSGIVRADSMEELFDLTLCFSYLAPPAGPRIAVVTNAGGPGVMAADAIERQGLQLATLREETRCALRDTLPAAASVGNPVDVLGDARSQRYATTLEIVAGDDGVDAMIALLTPQAMTNAEHIAQAVTDVARRCGKPVIASFMGGDAVAAGRKFLDEAHVPVFAYPERAVRALAALCRYGRYRRDLSG